MATGTHEYVDDPRNAEILININGELFPRSEAKDFCVRQRVYSREMAYGRAFDCIMVGWLLSTSICNDCLMGRRRLDLDIGLSKASLVAQG